MVSKPPSSGSGKYWFSFFFSVPPSHYHEHYRGASGTIACMWFVAVFSLAGGLILSESRSDVLETWHRLPIRTGKLVRGAKRAGVFLRDEGRVED